MAVILLAIFILFQRMHFYFNVCTVHPPDALKLEFYVLMVIYRVTNLKLS